MFGPLGGPQLVHILVLALSVFGPRRLPEIGESMGRLRSVFR
jgi:Sec-independent protein translocase protein TatA